MTTEDKIRAKAHWKMRVFITARRRCRAGFVVATPYGKTLHPSRREALQALFAAVRCEPMRSYTLKPVKK